MAWYSSLKYSSLKRYLTAYPASLIILAIATVGGTGILASRAMGMWQSLELRSLDYLILFRPLEPVDPRIVILEVSDQDIQRAKSLKLEPRWPWSDLTFAKILTQVAAAKPLVVGFDKYLDIPSQGGRSELLRAIAQVTLVNATLLPGAQTEQGVELAADLVPISTGGFVNMITGAGSMVHRALLGTDKEVSFAYAIAQEYLAQKYGRVMELVEGELQFGAVKIPRFSPNFGGFRSQDAQGYQIMINYRHAFPPFVHVSATDILEQRLSAAQLSQLLGNKIVLIGITAETVKDRLPTPFSLINQGTTPGVEIHAHIISQLLAAIEQRRPLIQVWSELAESLAILICTLLGGAIAARFKAVLANFGSLAVSAALLTGICWASFVTTTYWLPFVPCIVGLGLGNMAGFGYQFSQEQADRQLLANMFSRHVSPELVELLWQERSQFLNQGRIEGQELYATVLFTDMRNFSTAAEQQQPQEILNWLNTYLSAIAEEVIAHQGMVDKYIGDAVMAIFGVPVAHLQEQERNQDAQNAVQAALIIAKKLAVMSDRWQQQGLPAVVTGIGINSGMVIAGSLGSQERLEYSVIGDAVNIAARLESLNKEVDGGKYHILISEDTHNRLEGKFITEYVNHIALKGRAGETAVYRVLGMI